MKLSCSGIFIGLLLIGCHAMKREEPVSQDQNLFVALPANADRATLERRTGAAFPNHVGAGEWLSSHPTYNLYGWVGQLRAQFTDRDEFRLLKWDVTNSSQPCAEYTAVLLPKFSQSFGQFALEPNMHVDAPKQLKRDCWKAVAGARELRVCCAEMHPGGTVSSLVGVYLRRLDVAGHDEPMPPDVRVPPPPDDQRPCDDQHPCEE